MEQYYSILQQCGMFNGIQPRKYREVLRCLNATVREYPRGAHIVELGEQSHNTGVLLDGTMKEFFYDENGNQISICRFCPGEVFGAELACTGWTTSPVCLFGLYRNAAGFQRIDVTEDADLSLPDASHSKSYAGYGAAASLF